jgi:hypothetical protein
MSKVAAKGDKDKEEVGAEYVSHLTSQDQRLTSLRSADSEFYALQHERSRLLTDKETLQIIYEDLLLSHNTLKEEHVSPLTIPFVHLTD